MAMLDLDKLVTSISQEARVLAAATNYPEEAAPGAVRLSNEEKFRRQSVLAPIPDAAVLREVLEEVFWASCLSEERRPCHVRLLYWPLDRRPTTMVWHRLRSAVRLSRAQLRRLAPAHDDRNGHLAWRDASEEPLIDAIFPLAGFQEDPGLIIETHAPATLHVSLLGTGLLSYEAGNLRTLSAPGGTPILEALRALGTVVGQPGPILLGKVLAAIQRGGHGGAIWVLPTGANMSGLRIGYPVEASLGPFDIPRGAVPRDVWLDSVARLAAVDGALVVDREGRVLGFGAFINAGEDTVTVRIHQPPAEPRFAPSTELGGGRHRSAVEFCRRFAPAGAIVVSDDGRVTAMVASPGQTPDVWEIVPLGLDRMFRG